MNPLYGAGGALVALGARLLYVAVRDSLRHTGRTVDRLIAPTSVDCLPAASDQAWVGTAPVPDGRRDRADE